MRETIFESKQALNHGFATRIAGLLRDAINARGRASLIVSGGNTPKPLFAELNTQDIAWDKVDVSLADERWVATSDAASNEAMVREHLLQNAAAAANFVGLKTVHDDAANAVDAVSANMGGIGHPFDVLILGMGEDGHTASLFPCSAQIEQGLDLDSPQRYIAVQPTTAPNQRLSLTLPALLDSKAIFLHLTGDAKKQVLNDALQGDDEKAMPIRAVLNRADVELVWAP